MITNRRTKQTYDRYGNKTASLFGAPTLKDQHNFLLNSLPEALRSGLGTMIANLDESQAKSIIKLCQDPFISQQLISVIDDPDKCAETIATLQEQITDIKHHLKDKILEEPSFCRYLALMLGVGATELITPGLGLVLLGLPTVAATLPAIYPGIPEGGLDLCWGQLPNCIQGFIAEDGNMTHWFGQFSRQAELADFGGTLDTSFISCLSVNRVGEMIAPFFSAIANGTQPAQAIQCIANSPVIKDTMAILTSSGLDGSKNNCSTFASAMKPLYDFCKNYTELPTTTPLPVQVPVAGGSVPYIIAGVVSAAALAVIATVLICVLRKKCRKGYSEV